MNRLNKVTSIEEAIPHSESDRTEEALKLINSLGEDDLLKLTTWELQVIEDISKGRAATKIRLMELREAVKRIRKDAQTQA